MSDLDDLESDFYVPDQAGGDGRPKGLASRVAKNIRAKERVVFGRQGLNPNRQINGHPRATCSKGHALEGRNLFVTTSGSHLCRECKQAYERAAYARRQAAKGRP